MKHIISVSAGLVGAGVAVYNGGGVDADLGRSLVNALAAFLAVITVVEVADLLLFLGARHVQLSRVLESRYRSVILMTALALIVAVLFAYSAVFRPSTG